MKFVVQVWDGAQWMTSKHGGDTVEEAEMAEAALRFSDDAWVNPEAPKRTRIAQLTK